MSDPVRVLIADDHEVVREGLRMILEAEDGFAVVGEASDGVQAVELAGQLEPDVVLMDLRMPKMDGLEAIERIRANWPQVAIVILTTYNEDDLMLRGLRAGARGFLLKDTSRQTLFDSLRAAARGEALLLPDVVERLLLPGSPAAPPPASRPAKGSLLTGREREILERVARGERNKEIAAALGITERTVKAHLASIYNRLGVDSRAAAVAAARVRAFPSDEDNRP
jgi:two-component system, NarL family, response regulator YdfI